MKFVAKKFAKFQSGHTGLFVNYFRVVIVSQHDRRSLFDLFDASLIVRLYITIRPGIKPRTLLRQRL